MSPARLRYLVGTARLRFVRFLRDLRGRTRRFPRSARAVPRPLRLSRGARGMRLTHVLVASDLNPQYLEFWPLVRRAWAEVAALEPVLVLVAEPAGVPEDLRHDPQVHVFPPVAAVHTAFQAQCVRLLYPALLEVEGAVLISDADMVPMNRRYFHRSVARIPEEHFVAYRDLHLATREIPICYNAALPRTWGSCFGVATADDVRLSLAEWEQQVEYEGAHGGQGWFSDQHILYRTLLERGRATRAVWILDDHYTGFRRLERAVLSKRRRLDETDRRLIERGAYSDFHCVHPYSEFRELNELVVELAVDGARRP